MNAELLRLGSIIAPDQPRHRDAIHIAVAPLTAAEKLYPGDRVALNAGGTAVRCDPGIGVVDPFLDRPVQEGQAFWLFLSPGSITSLRHDWTHPAFDAPPPLPTKTHAEHVEYSRQKIAEIAAAIDIGVDVLMAAARRWVEDSDHTVERDRERWRDDFPAHAKEFWHHYEIVTDTKVPDHEATFFCCSC